MIGIIARPSDECVVREFFELFKTPWEFYQNERRYDVVLCTDGTQPDPVSARLLVVYGVGQTGSIQDDVLSKTEGGELSFSGKVLPVYGAVASFRVDGTSVLERSQSRESSGYVRRHGNAWLARIGYDLFHEIRTLLTTGQPSANASIPTIELHVAFLRGLILGSGVPLVEVPPIPHGYSFITCLTHDLDHALIRKHKFDATMLGFLYRATVMSSLNAVRGRLPVSRLVANWSAAAKLPFVYLGLAEDFWSRFNRYLELEEGRPSTFFVIPFAGRPGAGPNGKAPAARGAGYDVSDIATKVRELKSAGCEIGLHGIDAWNDATRGREESARISDVSASPTEGVRMHWLYRNQESPAVLEDADFSYDSTVGYNDTVGYRAGTAQVFKPLRANRLLELPLHIMDTALFYPCYLNLSDEEAWKYLRPILDNATAHGGVLTINWHDRSIAPERLWGDFYVRLLSELTRMGTLFCTASQAVSWFRRRRSVVFEHSGNRLCVRIPGSESGSAPLKLRFHRALASPVSFTSGDSGRENYTDTILNDGMELDFSNC